MKMKINEIIEYMVNSSYNNNVFGIDVEYFEYKDNYYPVLDFIYSLDNKLRSKIVRSITLLQNNGYLLKGPDSKYLTDGLYELRIIHGNNIARVLYFYDDGKAILTNGFIKKQDKTQIKEINKAKMYKSIYERRKKDESINT